MAPKLLVADDSVTVQRVIALTFADEDIEVIAVGDGRQALERLEADRPDIVLADVDMPHQNGYDIAAHVRQAAHLRHIPVLLLTGAFDPVDESRARAAGCDGVLVKPFEPQTVIARVRELLAGAPRDAPPAAGLPGTLVGAGAAAAVFSEAAAPEGEADARALDEYFDRLDAAFASLAAGPPASRPPLTLPDDPAAVGSTTPGAPPDEGSPDPSSAEPPLVDAFAALLAAERRAALPAGASSREAEPAISDDLVDAVARRVIERLTDQVVREVVSEVALEVSERLVREEIERIKRRAQEGG